ncbi:MAG: hypothetical protein GWM92_01740, partial [Gemmatimonadetes bacterium]|nr:hypothetical protein [Gemmatimonadota bacterium]NIT85721.1 hypothetical protein [Gemmatimonadota bacterium]NIU29552.1 hypothetical protein [Gemmatimonadota bacterium]NIU34596.1 hypothetical protein [Gemmatimonadota bacterium]NIV59965.1 hypothetical protein [Gemmatimonadota bacterium]
EGQRRRLESLLGGGVLEAGGYAPEAGAAGTSLPQRLVLEAVARSGVWRSRSLRTAL